MGKIWKNGCDSIRCRNSLGHMAPLRLTGERYISHWQGFEPGPPAPEIEDLTMPPSPQRERERVHLSSPFVVLHFLGCLPRKDICGVYPKTSVFVGYEPRLKCEGRVSSLLLSVSAGCVTSQLHIQGSTAASLCS